MDSPTSRRFAVRGALIAGLVGVLAFASGCSSSGSSLASPSSSAAPTVTADVDCVLTVNAMDDYGTGILDLAKSVDANDSMSAVAASDAMLYALDQLMPAIQQAGEPAQEFAAHAWAVAALVKGAVANGTTMQEALPQITAAFQDEAFETGGAVLQDFVEARCPAEGVNE